MRTGVRSLDEKGFAEAHKHQDSVRIQANSAKPYKAKGFEKKSLDETRARLKARMAEADKPEFYFGTKDEVEPTQFLIASAVGIFGFAPHHPALITDGAISDIRRDTVKPEDSRLEATLQPGDMSLRESMTQSFAWNGHGVSGDYRCDS